MAITDLTGYTWIGNDVLTFPSEDIQIEITFSCDNHPKYYAGLIIMASGSVISASKNDFGARTGLASRAIYLSNQWVTGYNKITFAGSGDTTNTTLIQWLETNGTLIPPQFNLIDKGREESCRYAEATAIRGKLGSSELIEYDFDNNIGFAKAIAKISTGITPTGNIQLTKQSGTDVTNYATASVRGASVSLNTPTVNSSGLVTASASVSTTGWIGSAPANKTLQLTTQAGKTVTPSASSQTAVASGRYTTGTVTVAAVPSETKSVALDMSSGNQTVNASSGKWMTSVTVEKPATLLPENIKKDVNIGGVVGTMESGGGITPTGNIELTQQSGTDVTNYATASVRDFDISGAQGELDDDGVVEFTVNIDQSGWIDEGPITLRYPLPSVSYGRTITPSASSQTAISAKTFAVEDIIVAAVPTETKTATANGDVTPTSGKFLSKVTVAIPVYDGSVS